MSDYNPATHPDPIGFTPVAADPEKK
jgi:hypothetical protein